MQVKSSGVSGMISKAHAHRLRCKQLPPIQAGEAERLVAAFLATNAITPCPERYAAPVEQRPQFVSGGR